MSRILCMLGCFFALCICASLASADIVVEFSSGGTTATNFDTTAGSTVTIEVFVTESGANNELSTEGLLGFGLVGNYGPTSGAGGTVNSNSVIDPAFTNVIDNSTTGSVVNMAAVDADPGDGFSTGTSIRLGEFDVVVSGVGVTQFTFDDYTPAAGFSDFATPAATDLDPVIFASGRTFAFTVTVVAVPEFGSLGVLGFLSGMLVLRRRRR